MELNLSEVPYKSKDARNDFILFSESNSRFMVEVAKKDQSVFERILKGLPFGLVGCISKNKTFKVFGLDGKVCINAGIGDLKESWQKPLRW
jgi:phosphoribosylformylglycinamidine synthase